MNVGSVFAADLVWAGAENSTFTNLAAYGSAGYGSSAVDYIFDNDAKCEANYTSKTSGNVVTSVSSSTGFTVITPSAGTVKIYATSDNNNDDAILTYTAKNTETVISNDSDKTVKNRKTAAQVSVSFDVNAADTITITSTKNLFVRRVEFTATKVDGGENTNTTTTTTNTTTTTTTTETTTKEEAVETTTSSIVYPSKAVEMKQYVPSYSTDYNDVYFKLGGNSVYNNSNNNDRLEIPRDDGKSYISFKVAQSCKINVTIGNKVVTLYNESGKAVISSQTGTISVDLTPGNYYFVNAGTSGAGETRITALSFESTAPSITGSVTVDGSAKSGVKVTLKNGTTTVGTATTDSTGAYKFDSETLGLTSGTDYTVSVAKGTAYEADVSVAVAYSGENVTADTIALTTAKYTVRFHTDIKDYKQNFIVKDSDGATAKAAAKYSDGTYCKENGAAEEIVFTSDKNTIGSSGETYRLSALNKYYEMPAGTYTIEYEGTNFTPVANGTSIPKGTTYTFTVPSVTKVNIIMQANELTDAEETAIAEINVYGALPVGTTSLKNLDVTAGDTYEGTGVTASTGSAKNGNDGVVGATSPTDGYVVFVIPTLEGGATTTYSVSITTANQSGALYAYSDTASINGSTTPVALDSNFGTYTLSLTSGKYVIKGASTAGATEVKSIAVYDYSVFEVTTKATKNGDKNNVIVVAKLKDSAVNAGTTPEKLEAGSLAVAFVTATDENLGLLQNAVSFKNSDSIYMETIDTMYEKVYADDDNLIVGGDDGYYHGFEIDGMEDDIYAVAAVLSNGQWNPDTDNVIKISKDGTAEKVTGTATVTE
jgi:hypothetical protein